MFSIGDEIEISWESPLDQPFPMPIEVEINGERKRLEMPKGKVRIKAKIEDVRIDPDYKILLGSPEDQDVRQLSSEE